jgi:hypothetical protein
MALARGNFSLTAECCSATRVMAGQRQPDGRSLRAMKMAWLTPIGKQRCRHRSIF